MNGVMPLRELGMKAAMDCNRQRSASVQVSARAKADNILRIPAAYSQAVIANITKL
ncbi:hypothetical protein D3C72_2349510 [compost metagenome]